MDEPRRLLAGVHDIETFVRDIAETGVERAVTMELIAQVEKQKGGRKVALRVSAAEGFSVLACGQRACESALRRGGSQPVLVLTRKSNQSIMIGDDIEVSVLSIMGEKVRIGIQAPREVPVFRKEVYLEIQQERAAEAAAKSGVRAEVDAALANLKNSA